MMAKGVVGEAATGLEEVMTPAEIERVTHGASEEDLVNSGLEETMSSAYHPIREEWKQRQSQVNLRTAAMIVAIDKVATSYVQLGIFP